MFQKFDTPSQKAQTPNRIAALRTEMRRLNIDAFIVPHSDEYQNEYLPDRAERLSWISGFTGSAGTAIIMLDSAHIFTDGRYTLQVREQCDPAIFKTHDSVSAGASLGLENWASKNMRIAADPWLHTMASLAALQKAADDANAALLLLDENPIDAIWTDQPAAPCNPVAIHPVELAGVKPKTKLAQIAKSVRMQGAKTVVLTDPSSICWAFNIRGSDVVHTPLVLAFAIVPANGEPKLFIDHNKLATRERAYLTQLCDLYAPDQFETHLALIGQEKLSVLLDPNLVAAKIANILESAGAEIIEAKDTCSLPRACKNRIERKGAIEAHKRDGAAMVTFLAWLDSQAASALDEIKIATKLEQTRATTGERLGFPLREISFDTISGAGPNGAIVHYRVNLESNRQLNNGELILIDSGAQYDDGTTDITRVVPIGEPTTEYQRHFTLVLKGMIAVSEAKFPKGTRGVDLDVLARGPLWANGLDYAHGTGHGVGSYLSVHEGPQGISKRAMTPFETGMIVSNEPGYYKEGSHGIRIENLLIVDPIKTPKDGDMAVHGFTTLTLCPIDRRLIDKKLLTPAERRWVNRYHAQVRRTLSKLVDDRATLEWLEKATARL